MPDFHALKPEQQQAAQQRRAQRALRFMKKRRTRKNYRWLCNLLEWGVKP